jgi:hypothetical protein
LIVRRKKEMLQKWWMTLEVDRRLAAGNKRRPPESFAKRFDPDAEMWLTYTELMALMFLAKPVIEGNNDGIGDGHARRMVDDAFAAWAKDNPLSVSQPGTAVTVAETKTTTEPEPPRDDG